MINAVVLLERIIKKIKDGLIVCHVGLSEDRARGFRRTSGLLVYRPLLDALSGQLLSPSGVNVSNYRISTVLAAQFYEAGTNAVGAA
jgi:hypothetical protein